MKQKLAYARVSTLEQANFHHALEQQIDRLQGVPDVVVLSDIESGARLERDNYQRVLSMIESGEVSHLYITRMDRLLRDLEIFLYLQKLVRKHKVKVISLDEGELDWDTPAGELTINLFALLAQNERRMLQDRVLKGFKYRRKRKAACARAPFGYQTVDDRYVLDQRPIVCLRSRRPANYQELAHFEEEYLPYISRADIARELIDQIFITRRPRTALRRLYEEYGLERKMGQIPVLAEELLLFGQSGSVIDWCRNPVLQGNTAYLKTEPTGEVKERRAKPAEDWEIHYNTHPDQRLLTEVESNELEAIFNCNSKKMGDPEKGTFYLTGLIYCEACGHRMVLKNSQSHRYYGCRNSGLGCSNHKNIRAEALDEAVIGQLFERASKGAQTAGAQDIVEPENLDIAEIREELQLIDTMLQRRSTPKLQKRKHDLEQELAELLNPTQTTTFIQATAEQILQHPQARELAFWYTLPERERTVIYHMLVNRIVVSAAGQVVAVTLRV